MENNVLNWFRTTFHTTVDENGSLIVSSKYSCFMKDIEQQLLDASRKDIINILKILNDNYPISDGGSSWLETEEDYERTADEIIEFENHYKNKESNSEVDDNTPCKNWNGPNPNGWACKIFCMHPSNCDGMSCKKDCDFYNGKGYFKGHKSIKKK